MFSLRVALFRSEGLPSVHMCIYIRVPLVATRHFSPAPRRSACDRPCNKERKNKVRLHSIDSARSSVSSLLEREKEEATSIEGFSCLVCHDRSVIYTWRVTSRSIFAPVSFADSYSWISRMPRLGISWMSHRKMLPLSLCSSMLLNCHDSFQTGTEICVILEFPRFQNYCLQFMLCYAKHSDLFNKVNFNEL